MHCHRPVGSTSKRKKIGKILSQIINRNQTAIEKYLQCLSFKQYNTVDSHALRYKQHSWTLPRDSSVKWGTFCIVLSSNPGAQVTPLIQQEWIHGVYGDYYTRWSSSRFHQNPKLIHFTVTCLPKWSISAHMGAFLPSLHRFNWCN